MLSTVLALLCVGHVLADDSDLAKGLSQVLPADIAEKVNALKVEDFKNVSDFFGKLATAEGAERGVSKASPAVKDLLAVLVKDVGQAKADATAKLKPDTKDFLNQTGHFFLKAFLSYDQIYSNQSDVVKQDLRKHFPRLMLFLEQPKFQNNLVSYCGYGCGGGYGGYGRGYGGYGVDYNVGLSGIGLALAKVGVALASVRKFFG